MELKNRRKRILVMVDWFEPGYKAGGPIRSCVNFAENMKQEYDIYIYTGDRDLGDVKPYAGIALDRWINRKDSTSVFYAASASLRWKSMKHEIVNIRPDYVYLNSMYSRYFALYPLLMKYLGAINAQIVLAPRGMLQQGAIQFKKGKKEFFIRLLNIVGISKYIMFHATDEQEYKDIKKFFPGSKQVFIADNFPKAGISEWKSVHKIPGELRLIFLSRISPKKNLLYLLEALGQTSSVNNIFLSVRGEIDEKEYWSQCIEKISDLPSHVSVRYEGPVPNENIFELYKQFHVFALPTLGENFGHAIYEALLAGKPVLISDKTPWRNLVMHKAGWDISLKDTEGFVNVIEAVAEMNQEEYDEWSKSAWVFAKNHFKESTIKEQYRQLFN